jgi:hypothetical protein
MTIMVDMIVLEALTAVNGRECMEESAEESVPGGSGRCRRPIMRAFMEFHYLICKDKLQGRRHGQISNTQ